MGLWLVDGVGFGGVREVLVSKSLTLSIMQLVRFYDVHNVFPPITAFCQVRFL